MLSIQALSISFILAALALLAIALFARRKSKARGNIVLLVGPSDGGKTAILSALAFEQTLPTHASLQPNACVVELPDTKKTLRVVDIPGYPRIRNQHREYFADAKAVVFVVDASTVSRNGAAVAEHLHQILHSFISLPPSQHSPALLILAHKCDLVTTTATSGPADQLAINRVRTVLERELEKRRSQAGGMGIESLGGGGGEGEDGSEFGGLECSGSGGAFRFSEWEGGEICFLGSSVSVKETGEKSSGASIGLEGLRQFVQDLP